MEDYGIPIGFGMALAMNLEAMQKFASLPEYKKQEIINELIRFLQKQKCSSMLKSSCRCNKAIPYKDRHGSVSYHNNEE